MKEEALKEKLKALKAREAEVRSVELSLREMRKTITKDYLDTLKEYGEANSFFEKGKKYRISTNSTDAESIWKPRKLGGVVVFRDTWVTVHSTTGKVIVKYSFYRVLENGKVTSNRYAAGRYFALEDIEIIEAL